MHAAHVSVFYGLFCDKNVSAKGNFGLKTNLVISSMEYCGCLFNEREIRPGFSSGGGHTAMIPLPIAK
jgi:hypothetical protein